jgi:hypothetical protein
MNTPNPFAPPAANLDGPVSGFVHPTADVPETVITILAQTRPWLRLMLGLFVTGMSLLVAVFIGFGVLGWFAPRGRPPGFGLGMLFPLLLVVGIYTPPAVYLARSAGSIRRLQQGGSWPALEDALRNQKNLWRYLGIMILVLIAVYTVAFLVGLAAL